MKNALKTLALAVAMTLSGAAFAADAPPAGPGAANETPKTRPQRMPGIRGKVTAVSGNTITVTGRAGEKTVTVDDKTKFTLDGADGKLADIKPDVYISATPETGTATEVKIMTKAPTRKPKGDKPADAPKPDAPAPK